MVVLCTNNINNSTEENTYIYVFMYMHGFVVVVVLLCYRKYGKKHTKQKQNTNTLTHGLVVQKYFINTYT